MPHTPLSEVMNSQPNAFQESMRRIGHKLPYTKIGKKLASIVLRLAGGGKPHAFDVTIFGSQKARLHPYDNICEKRVYITPHFWDPQERAFLKKLVETSEKPHFTFLDVGANAGLYSLFTLSACATANKKAAIICIEPDPIMRARLQHNITASNAEDQCTILPWAITAKEGEVILYLNPQSRGMNHLSENPNDPEAMSVVVDGHPLLSALTTFEDETIDVMKMDIEGAEFPALEAFFQSAKAPQKPRHIIIETSHDDAVNSALALCLENGYAISMQNNLNTILHRK